MYTCPACGFRTFDEGPGSYEICAVCNWEDDEVQLRFPAMHGGANGDSLLEWQVRILETVPVSITLRDGFLSDPEWRPLRPEECQDRENTPQSGREYFDAIGQAPASYYWKID